MRRKLGIAALVTLLLISAFLFTDAAPAFQRLLRRGGQRSGAARINTIRKERAYAEVRVRHHTPRLLSRPNEPIEEPFEIFRNAQLRFIKSPFILTPALRSINELQIIRQQPDALKFLEEHIEVDVLAEEFLIVSFDGPRSDETAKIVNAVIGAYLEEVVYTEAASCRERLNLLEKAATELDMEIKRKWSELKELQRALGLDEPLMSDKGKVIGQYQNHVVQELARAKIELIRDRTRLRNAKAKAELAAAGERDLDSEVERRVEEDAVAAALVARKLIVRLLLAEGDKGDVSRQQSPELERELAIIEKALAERQTELRQKVANEFERDVRENGQRRQAVLQLAVSESEAWVKQLQDELSQIQRGAANASASFDTVALTDDIMQMQKIDREIKDEINWLRIRLRMDSERGRTPSARVQVINLAKASELRGDM